jgi:hypothetical protein
VPTNLCVRSVPSDSPDDWRALQDLRELDADQARKKYGLEGHSQMLFEVILLAVSDNRACLSLRPYASAGRQVLHVGNMFSPSAVAFMRPGKSVADCRGLILACR